MSVSSYTQFNMGTAILTVLGLLILAKLWYFQNWVNIKKTHTKICYQALIESLKYVQ